MKALLVLSTDRDTKTCSESRSLLHGICDFQFVFSLCALKIIYSNTSSLSTYLQGKTARDVFATRRNANLTLETLKSSQNDENFTLVWKRSESIGVKMKSWIAESQFSFRDARVPRRQPSTRLEELVEENKNASAAGPPSKPEDYHRAKTFYTSLDKVLAEIENMFSRNDQDVLCALGDVTLSNSLTNDSFDLVAGYYNAISTRSYSRQTNVCSIE